MELYNFMQLINAARYFLEKKKKYNETICIEKSLVLEDIVNYSYVLYCNNSSCLSQ